MPATVTVNSRTYTGQPPRILKLHADYVCANTGLCCEDGWGIHLTDAERERIRATLAATGMEAARIEGSFVTVGERNLGTATFARGECGCVFHAREGGESHCTLHKAHGHVVLPTICQSYPRIAIRTPAGIYLTLSCACPTAARLLLGSDGLREVAPGRVTAATTLLGGSVFGEEAAPPRLSADCAPPWEVFDYIWRWGPEWMAQAGVSPGLALFGLGLVIGHIEGLGRAAADLNVVVDTLEGALRDFAPQLVPLEARLEPQSPLGAVYLDTLLNVVAQFETIPPALAALRGLGRERIAALYDELVRGELPRHELIVRNYIASRLYANQLTYFANWLRSGYFVVVLMAVAHRFTALALCHAAGRALVEADLLEAAGIVDKLLLHNPLTSARIIKLLEAHIQTDIRNLAQPAIA